MNNQPSISSVIAFGNFICDLVKIFENHIDAESGKITISEEQKEELLKNANISDDTGLKDYITRAAANKGIDLNQQLDGSAKNELINDAIKLFQTDHPEYSGVVTDDVLAARYEVAFDDYLAKSNESIDNIDLRIGQIDKEIDGLNSTSFQIETASDDAMSPEDKTAQLSVTEDRIAKLETEKAELSSTREELLQKQETVISFYNAEDRLEFAREHAADLGIDKNIIESDSYNSEVDTNINDNKVDADHADKEANNDRADTKEDMLKERISSYTDKNGNKIDADETYKKLEKAYKGDTQKIESTLKFVDERIASGSGKLSAEQVLSKKIDYDNSLKSFEKFSQTGTFRNVFTTVSRLSVDIKAYQLGIAGASGKAVSGGKIFLDILEVSRGSLVTSLLELGFSKLCDLILPERDQIDSGTAKEDHVNLSTTRDDKPVEQKIEAQPDVTEPQPDDVEPPKQADGDADMRQDLSNDIDDKIKAVESIKGNLEGEVDIQKNKLDNIDKNIERIEAGNDLDKQEKLSDLKAERDELTNKIEAAEQQIEKYQNVLDKYEEAKDIATNDGNIETATEKVHEADIAKDDALKSDVDNKIDGFRDKLEDLKDKIEQGKNPDDKDKIDKDKADSKLERAEDRVDSALSKIDDPNVEDYKTLDSITDAFSAANDAGLISPEDMNDIKEQMAAIDDINEAFEDITVDDIKDEIEKALDQKEDGAFSVKEYLENNIDEDDIGKVAEATKEILKDRLNDSDLSSDKGEDFINKLSDIISDCMDAFASIIENEMRPVTVICDFLENVFTGGDPDWSSLLDMLLDRIPGREIFETAKDFLEQYFSNDATLDVDSDLSASDQLDISDMLKETLDMAAAPIEQIPQDIVAPESQDVEIHNDSAIQNNNADLAGRDMEQPGMSEANVSNDIPTDSLGDVLGDTESLVDGIMETAEVAAEAVDAGEAIEVIGEVVAAFA